MLRVKHETLESFYRAYQSREERSEVLAEKIYLCFTCKNRAGIEEFHFVPATIKELNAYCMRNKLTAPSILEIDGVIVEAVVSRRELRY